MMKVIYNGQVKEDILYWAMRCINEDYLIVEYDWEKTRYQLNDWSTSRYNNQEIVCLRYFGNFIAFPNKQERDAFVEHFKEHIINIHPFQVSYEAVITHKELPTIKKRSWFKQLLGLR